MLHVNIIVLHVNINQSQGNRIMLQVNIRFPAGRDIYVKHFYFNNHCSFVIIKVQRVIHTIHNYYFSHI